MQTNNKLDLINNICNVILNLEEKNMKKVFGK